MRNYPEKFVGGQRRLENPPPHIPTPNSFSRGSDRVNASLLLGSGLVNLIYKV